MAGLDPRTPVLVGGGQVSNRVDRGETALEPVELLTEAARRAAADTGVADAAGVLAAVDAVRVAHILSWPYRDDPARPLTVTGGLSFAGGPWNNYVTHAIATMLDVLGRRGGAGRAVGLVTANGGFATKHSFGVYATEPPTEGFRWERPQREVDARIRAPGVVEAPTDAAGRATVEAYTVMHDRDDTPETAIVVARVPDGRRAWATSSVPDVRTALLDGEWVGRTIELLADGGLAV